MKGKPNHLFRRHCPVVLCQREKLVKLCRDVFCILSCGGGVPNKNHAKVPIVGALRVIH